MNTIVIFSVSIFCFLLSTILFHKAAGTLNPGKLNVVSYVYYLFLLQTFIGIVLIMLGFDKHYTLDVLIHRKFSCQIAYVVIMSVSVMLPLGILVIEKLLRFKPYLEYTKYLGKKADTGRGIEFGIVCVVSIISLVLMVMFFIKIGYIPLVKLMTASSDFDFAIERGRLAEIILLNQYVTNICILAVIPLLSYLTFAYAVINREKKWYVLAFILWVAAVLVKTYKFEKSPLVFHMLVYVLIFIYIHGGIKRIFMGLCAGIMTGMIILFYVLTGFHGSLLDIYNGPLGRTLFTQVGTLIYVFDLFPNVFGFLNGRSLSPTVLSLLGMGSDTHLRSAKLTMAFFGAERVYDGSAGVMNSVFFGEAYANWGISGVVFSIIWVAIVIAVVFWVVMKLKKTPFTVTFFAMMVVKIGNTSQGGFCDFIYSFDFILTSVVLLGGYILFNHDGKASNYVVTRLERLGDRFCRQFKR